MKKILLLLVAVLAVHGAQGMKYTCGSFNSSKKTCKLIGWSGAQPSSGKLTLPSTYTHTDGVTYTITAVAANALNDLTDVTEIVVPTSITVIGNSNDTDKTKAGVENFNNCPNLIKFKAESGHTTFSTLNSGILCSKDGDVLYRVPAEIAVDADGEIDLNSKIRFITNGSFTDNNSIKILVLPAAVFSISNKAGFNTMKTLAKFSLSSDNDEYAVIDGALVNTYSKWLLSYPPKRTNQNVTITSNVEMVRARAFANTKYLKTLTLPQTVIDIEDEAFFNSSVTSIAMPKKLEEMGTRVFAKSKLESMTMWAPTNFDGYTEDTFAYCTNLKTLTVNGSNPRFCQGFARGCTALTSVTCATTPKEIRGAAFKGCTQLSSFPFSASTEVIGDSIFAETGFKEVVYPSDAPLDGLEQYMFYGCRQLEKVDLSAVTGPESKNYMVIAPHAITSCPKLKEIYFPKYASFASLANLSNTPNIGPTVPLDKIVLHSFSNSDNQVFVYYSTLFTPDVYIKTTDLTNCHGELNKLFAAANGGQVRPRFYLDGAEPVSPYTLAVENATYYIPGNCRDNYKIVADNSKCLVIEMYSLDVQNVSGKAKVTVVPDMPGVEITYVTFNEAFGAKPNAEGVVSMGNSYSDVKTVRVSYTVNGEKMSTVYTKDLFSGKSDIALDTDDFKVSVSNNMLTVNGVDPDARIGVTNLAGVEVASGCGTEIDLSNVIGGIYVVTACDRNGIRSAKICVTR